MIILQNKSRILIIYTNIQIQQKNKYTLKINKLSFFGVMIMMLNSMDQQQILYKQLRNYQPSFKFKDFISIFGQQTLKYNYQIMYLSTPETLQNILAQDWTTLIKNIRKREDLYYQLVFHSHTAYQKQFLNQDQIRITTWIEQNNTLVAKIKQYQIQMSEQQHKIIEKYEHSIISFQNCIKLMGRIGAQILQILKIASNKIRSFDDSASSRFKTFKAVFMVILTQREKLNLQNAIKVVVEYCKQKMQNYITKIQRNIDSIKRRQFVLPQQKNKKINPQTSMVQTEKQRENVFFQKKRDLSRKEQIFIQRQLYKQNSQIQQIQTCQKIVSKHPKPEEVKQKNQHKLSQKHLKIEKIQKKKFKLYDSLYNVMLLSRHQPNEDLVGSINVNNQRIYLELLNKNKRNINQILNFTTRYGEIKQNPLNFEQNQKKNSQTQINSISFILKTTKQNTQIQDNIEKQEYFHFIATEEESNTNDIIDNNQESLRNHMKKIAITRKKINDSPQIKVDDFPILTCKINKYLLSSIKNDSSKQQKLQFINNRLPDIKRVSIDQKKNLFNYKTNNDYRETIDNIQESGFKQSKKGQSFFREERIQSQRTKMILKNVQVGIDIPNKKGQRFCKQEELTFRQRKKTDTTLQSTIYMRRTINKFIDNKLNLFF